MNVKIKNKIITGLIFFLLNLTQTSDSCNITLTSCKVTSWPGNGWAVSSHADPLNWLKRRWFGRCTQQISDLKDLMNHGDISICSCISTINLVCKSHTPFLYGVCVNDLCTKQSKQDSLTKHASNTNINKNTATSNVVITNTSSEYKTNIFRYIVYIIISIFTLGLVYVLWKQCQSVLRCIKRWTPKAQANQTLTGINNGAFPLAENKKDLPNILPSYQNNQRKTVTTELELN